MKSTRQVGRMTVWMLAGLLVGTGIGARAQDAGLEFGVEDDLTVKGTNGTLTDADLEVKGYSVFGSATGLSMPASFTNGPGSVVVASNLYVNGQIKAGSIDLSGAAMTVSNLTVQGFLHANGNSVEVLKPAMLRDSLTVSNGANVGSLDVVGNAAVGGTLEVGDAATLDSTLSVAGTATISANALVNGTGDSSDKTTGALVVGGGVGVGKNLNAGGNLGVTGNGLVGGTLGVTGATALGNTLGVTGAASLSSTLGVAGTATMSSNALVNGTGDSTDKTTGALVVGGGVGVGKNLNAGGNLGVTGNGLVGGTLGVTGAASLQNNLGVGGNLTVTGTSTVNNTLTASQSAYLATGGGAVGIGTNNPDASTELQVVGGGSSGDYVAKFYSGADLAAWIRRK